MNLLLSAGLLPVNPAAEPRGYHIVDDTLSAPLYTFSIALYGCELLV